MARREFAAFKLALDVGIAIGVLLLLREFRAWAIPVFRGEPFDSRHLVKCAPATTFVMGAVPSGALAFTACDSRLNLVSIDVFSANKRALFTQTSN